VKTRCIYGEIKVNIKRSYRRDLKDREEKILAHLSAGKLDRLTDREEVVHPIVDSATGRSQTSKI
jgi:hypothetical protein